MIKEMRGTKKLHLRVVVTKLTRSRHSNCVHLSLKMDSTNFVHVTTMCTSDDVVEGVVAAAAASSSKMDFDAVLVCDLAGDGGGGSNAFLTDNDFHLSDKQQARQLLHCSEEIGALALMVDHWSRMASLLSTSPLFSI